ncbi:hypothetical protein BLX88_20525, partial [Bacillus obstructivus]
INGRYIKSIPLNQAIIRGYHTLLPIGRSPIVVLSINMDPILVDVNVHPTKLEVRFSKDKELYTQIEELIRHKFREFTLIPEMTETSKLKPKEKSYQHSMDFNSSSSVIESNDSVRETIGNWSKPADVEADALEDNLAPTNSSSPKEDIITSYEVNKDEI